MIHWISTADPENSEENVKANGDLDIGPSVVGPRSRLQPRPTPIYVRPDTSGRMV